MKKTESTTEAVLSQHDGHVKAAVLGWNRQHICGFWTGDSLLENVGGEFADVFGRDVSQDDLSAPEHLEDGGRE